IQAATGQIAKVNAFMVFNRWGEAVFNLQEFAPNDPANGWNGQFRGRELDPGVFVYWAEIELINGDTKLYKGDVTLVR
ncbi:MAG: gliding motility-associated C-terminal domain-containing protein, partial [Bacteroidota bacterium]